MVNGPLMIKAASKSDGRKGNSRKSFEFLEAAGTRSTMNGQDHPNMVPMHKLGPGYGQQRAITDASKSNTGLHKCQ